MNKYTIKLSYFKELCESIENKHSECKIKWQKVFDEQIMYGVNYIPIRKLKNLYMLTCPVCTNKLITYCKYKDVGNNIHTLLVCDQCAYQYAKLSK